MRFLILLAVLAGCKSSPVEYEMMEVNGEKLSNMRRSFWREKQDMLLKMYDRNAGQQRPCRGLLGPCRAIPGAKGALLATSRIDAGGGVAAEQRTARGNQTTDAGIGLSAEDLLLQIKGRRQRETIANLPMPSVWRSVGFSELLELRNAN